MVPDETLAEALTEVQRLEHRVGVARVAEVFETLVAFAVRDLSVELLLQSGGAVTLRTRAGDGTRWAGDRAVSTGTARLGHWNILSAGVPKGEGAPRRGLGSGRRTYHRVARLPGPASCRARTGRVLDAVPPARLTPPSDVASSRLVSSCGESFVASVCTPTLRVSSDGRPAAPAPLLDAQTRRGRIEEGPSSLPPRPWWRDISLTASATSRRRCARAAPGPQAPMPHNFVVCRGRPPRQRPSWLSGRRFTGEGRGRQGFVAGAGSQTPPSCPGTSVSDHCARPPRDGGGVHLPRGHPFAGGASTAFHGVRLAARQVLRVRAGLPRVPRLPTPRSHANARE